ncbi:unnamed protein product [Adineta steineri]|uniref:LamG-like jellyroll fold domain-containing protein n=1 Tax=Adineta steineri TaxID=433720 RepID=A0A819YPZ1_9BILA|nr:unnamed protein product [Adineta steineri]
MSLWVQRTSTRGGTLVHYSTQTDGQGWCTVPIGFFSAGNIVATAWAPNTQVTGPILLVNTWTHIATTYSQINGLTLYVNGVSVGSTGAQSNDASGAVVILTLGNSLSGGSGCGFQSIAPGPFYGYLDEFRVYSRELSAREVSALTKDKTCFDGIMNGDETDIDCGGSCLTCAVGQKCTLAKDCDSAHCINSICANATCNDNIKNNGETDVDCGGSNCSPCGTGKACSGGSDCVNSSCVSGTCKSNNLLMNPGGEDGVLSPWVVGGNSNPQLDTGTFDPGNNPHTGLYQFSGHTGSFGMLTQTVAIVGANRSITTSQIDAGNLTVGLLFWSSEYPQSPSDSAAVALYFLDAFNGTLSNVTSPEQAAGSNWISYSNSYPIPIGTRSIQYQMVFTLHSGSTIDSFIDDNSMTIC